jgi:hypothetical protein
MDREHVNGAADKAKGAIKEGPGQQPDVQPVASSALMMNICLKSSQSRCTLRWDDATP